MNNNFLSPLTAGNQNRSDILSLTVNKNNKPRAQTKAKKGRNVSIDQNDSMNSIEDIAYNKILPDVKVKAKKKNSKERNKHYSPSSGSGGRQSGRLNVP